MVDTYSAPGSIIISSYSLLCDRSQCLDDTRSNQQLLIIISHPDLRLMLSQKSYLTYADMAEMFIDVVVKCPCKDVTDCEPEGVQCSQSTVYVNSQNDCHFS